MAQLMNQTQQKVLVQNLSVADNFMTRSKGLLGTKSLEKDSALWIHRCNSIHTFFMNYGIDCVFLDKNLKVKKVVQNVVPNRLVLPIWGAASVVEMPAGIAIEKNIQIGDQLYVGN